MKCSPVPKDCRKSWTLWVRDRPDYWQLHMATNDPARAIEECDHFYCLETLVLPPGQRPMMPKGQCLKGIEL